MAIPAGTVAIEVVSDVVCPWCYVGKRRLAKALALLGDEVKIDITYLPFQLNPDMPDAGMPRSEYRKAKFGSIERGRELDARVAAEGKGEGIEFAFERIETAPNTFRAHQLIDLAQESGKGQEAVDALFRAYFEEARDVGDAEVLKSIAKSCGVSPEALEARWADEGEARRVADLEKAMKAMGVSGVPTFIFNRRYAVSGAHPPESLAAAIREAAGAAAASP